MTNLDPDLIQTIVVLGATSAIAKAFIRQCCNAQTKFVLVGRDEEALDAIKSDLIIRKARSIETIVADLADCFRAKETVQAVMARCSRVDLLFISYGILGDNAEALKDNVLTQEIITSNFTSVACLLSEFTPIFEKQKTGSIAVITSVAGDRGRQSNYIYGSAKGGLALFLQGLRHYLSKYGVHVLTIKPGFVDTPMTSAFKKGLLWASPEKIARGIRHALLKKKSSVYLPGFWKWIMIIIKLVPESIFHKTKL